MAKVILFEDVNLRSMSLGRLVPDSLTDNIFINDVYLYSVCYEEKNSKVELTIQTNSVPGFSLETFLRSNRYLYLYIQKYPSIIIKSVLTDTVGSNSATFLSTKAEDVNIIKSFIYPERFILALTKDPHLELKDQTRTIRFGFSTQNVITAKVDLEPPKILEDEEENSLLQNQGFSTSFKGLALDSDEALRALVVPRKDIRLDDPNFDLGIDLNYSPSLLNIIKPRPVSLSLPVFDLRIQISDFITEPFTIIEPEPVEIGDFEDDLDLAIGLSDFSSHSELPLPFLLTFFLEFLDNSNNKVDLDLAIKLDDIILKIDTPEPAILLLQPVGLNISLQSEMDYDTFISKQQEVPFFRTLEEASIYYNAWREDKLDLILSMLNENLSRGPYNTSFLNVNNISNRINFLSSSLEFHDSYLEEMTNRDFTFTLPSDEKVGIEWLTKTGLKIDKFSINEALVLFTENFLKLSRNEKEIELASIKANVDKALVGDTINIQVLFDGLIGAYFIYLSSLNNRTFQLLIPNYRTYKTKAESIEEIFNEYIKPWVYVLRQRIRINRMDDTRRRTIFLPLNLPALRCSFSITRVRDHLLATLGTSFKLNCILNFLALISGDIIGLRIGDRPIVEFPILFDSENDWDRNDAVYSGTAVWGGNLWTNRNDIDDMVWDDWNAPVFGTIKAGDTGIYETGIIDLRSIHTVFLDITLSFFNIPGKSREGDIIVEINYSEDDSFVSSIDNNVGSVRGTMSSSATSVNNLTIEDGRFFKVKLIFNDSVKNTIVTQLSITGRQ